jgi:hypothetical protein
MKPKRLIMMMLIALLFAGGVCCYEIAYAQAPPPRSRMHHRSTTPAAGIDYRNVRVDITWEENGTPDKTESYYGKVMDLHE